MVESGWVPVRVRDCKCPGSVHAVADPVTGLDGDLVYLLPSLSLEGGAMAELDREIVMDGFDAATEAEKTVLSARMLARWTSTYVRYGAVAWNWLRARDNGLTEPEPFDVERLVSDYAISRLVAGKANELYSSAVLSPLLEAAAAAAPKPNRQQRRSRSGRTAAPTSPKPGTTSTPSGSSSEPASDGPQLRIAR
jgi:hypothetical protein